MDFSFLNNFDTRMKRVGAYALIFKNSLNKLKWKNFGFNEFDEQTNITFATMLFIMEESLKENNCTIDDIGNFIDNLNMSYFNKPLSYEDCKELAKFLIDSILCDEGNPMYFNGFNFSEKNYNEININFLNNKAVYIDNSVKRTSYYLSNDGYSLLLSTMEMESNMQLTIHEMIFKMHLEKKSYDKAVDDIKNIFNILRKQIHEMQEAILRIKQNALSFSSKEYKKLMDDNNNSLDSSSLKFEQYRILVNERIKEFEEKDINIHKLSKEEVDNLNYLITIEKYLGNTIEAKSKFLDSYFDFKMIYGQELENLSQMNLIKRFNIKTDLYDKVLTNIDSLDNIHLFIKPLLNKNITKLYNINKCLTYQKNIKKAIKEDNEDMLSIDEELFLEEQLNEKKRKFDIYNNSLNIILDLSSTNGSISLEKISKLVEKDTLLKNSLIPTIEIFREIIIELLKCGLIQISELENEKENFTSHSTDQFQLNESILYLINSNSRYRNIKNITTCKLFDNKTVKFNIENNEIASTKIIKCSNIQFSVELK